MSKLVNHLRGKNVNNMFLEIAYGKHVVEGDLCKSLTTAGAPKDIYVQHKLGKREWNKCQSLYWRGFAIPESDYAFHPGKLSSGNADPIQGVDAIFDLDIPHSLQAWIRAKLPQSEIQEIDPSKEEPSGLYGFFECLKINDYNANGQIIDFSYSPNPAREVLDLFLVEGKRSASRIDFGAWTEWRDFLNLQKMCDYSQIPNFKGFGLTARYYNGPNFETFVTERIDAVVEFMNPDGSASNGAPAYGLNTDNFSARYEGKLKARFTEAYTFTLLHNDGGRLWVGGELLIDQWGATGTHTAVKALTAGQFYDIKVEWQDLTGDTEIRLEWESATQPKEVIPAECLYPKPALKTNYESHIAFKGPTRLDEAVRAILRQCNSTYQRVNGKYRFFCFDQLQNSSFTFDEESNFYPKTVEIEPADLTQVRNVWQASFLDLDSQYLETIENPLLIELESLISKVNRRIDGELLNFHNTSRWQAYRLTEAIMRRSVALNTIRLTGNCESYPVLKNDRVKLNLEFQNFQNYECRVTRSVDKSSEKTADDREFVLKEWYPSELVPELTPDETAPTAPVLSLTSKTTTQLNFGWTESFDVGGISYYEFDFDGGVSQVGNNLSTVKAGLTVNSAHTAKVRAYDHAGNVSAWSNILNVSTNAPVVDTTPPSVPVLSLASKTATALNYSWTAASDAGGSGVSYYEFYFDGAVSNIGNILSLSKTALANGSEHTAKVRAVDAAGNPSAWSNVLTESTDNTPAPGTPWYLSVNSYGYGVSVSWSLVEDADGYELEEDGVWHDMGPNTNADRNPGYGYHWYRIRAYNSAGYSEWSAQEFIFVNNYGF